MPITIFEPASAFVEKEQWNSFVSVLDVNEDIPSVAENPWAREYYEAKLKAFLPYHGRSPLVDSAIERLQAALSV